MIDVLTADRRGVEYAQCTVNYTDSNFVSKCQPVDKDMMDSHTSFLPA